MVILLTYHEMFHIAFLMTFRTPGRLVIANVQVNMEPIHQFHGKHIMVQAVVYFLAMSGVSSILVLASQRTTVVYHWSISSNVFRRTLHQTFIGNNIIPH